MRKRILSMVLVLCMIISLLPMQAMGEGGYPVLVEPPLKEGVYEISTPEQLNWFSGLVNGTLTGVTQNRTAKGKLMADIVATNDFVPIGPGDPTANTADEGYKGVFDGDMHTVTLNINNPGKAAQGLFGIVGGGAEIKNVGVDGKVSGSHFTAGIVGMSKTEGTVKISNSWNNAEVTTKNSTDTTKGQNAAGIFACAAYHNAQVIIENCYNTGNISGRKESATISGWLGSKGKVINTYNTGSIQGNDSGVTFARYDGGNGNNPFTNSYQLNTAGIQTATGLATKNLEEFKSGQVAYLLNGSKSLEPLVWGQVIGTNDYPVFHNWGNIVYYDATAGYYNNIENKISAKLAEVTLNSAKIEVLGTVDSEIYYVASHSETPLTAEEIVNQATEIQKITLTAINGEISLTNLTAGKDYTYYLVKKVSEGQYSNIVEVKFATIIVTLNKTSLTIEEGTTETLTYTVSPDGASGLTWSSSDEAVAIVNNDGLVTALSKGQTTIKITTAGGNLLASCEIKVEQVYEYVKITIDGIEGIDIKAYTGKSKIVEIPEIIDGLPVIQISNNTGSGSGAFANKGLTKVTIPDTVMELWHSAFANSSLESIVLPYDIKYINWSAFENNKESFTIYGKPGITSDAQKSAESYALKYGYIFKPTYNLNKTKLYTRIGKEESIKVKIGDQAAANESFIWTSDDESIATVDSAGKITPIAIGRTQVKMATTDGKYESICQVIVVAQPTTDEQRYYEISTADDLDRFAQIVNSGTSNVQGKLMSDIVANPGFEPIGFWDMDNLSARPYTGIFDGNGKTVTLNINNPASMGQGLFGLVGDGVVIENVNVDGSVSGGTSIGGIVGLSNAADDATVTISNCSNNATINANASRLGIGKNAAGILGNVLNNPNILIENCYNTGNIKGERESAAIAGDLGIKGKINNSHNVGNVQGNANGKTFAGYHANNSNPFTNSYQLDTVGIQEGIFKKTMEQFKSGELLDLLNGSESGQTPIWAQLIGIDDYPVFYNENMQVDISGELIESTAKTAKIKVSGDPNSTVYYIVKDTPLTKEEIKAPAIFIDENKKLTLNNSGYGEISLTGLTTDQEYTYYLAKKISEEKYLIGFSWKINPISISGELLENTTETAKIKVKGGINSQVYYIVSETPLTGDNIPLQIVEGNEKITLDNLGNGEINLIGLEASKEYTYYLVEDIGGGQYSNVFSGGISTTTVTLNLTSLVIRPGEKFKLVVTVEPQGASEITWSSTDQTVATVDQDGLVTAIKNGKTTIKVTPSKGNKIVTCDLTVTSDYHYTFNDDGTVKITGYTGSSKDIIIPPMLGGKRVTEIGEKVFQYKNLTNVILPEGLTTIERIAFYYNNNLENINVPESVTSIGDSAFRTGISGKLVTIYGKPGSEAESYAGRFTQYATFKPALELNKTKFYLGIVEEERLLVRLLGSLTIENLSWSSSDASVASVNSIGLVKGLKAGKTQIQVKTNDGKHLSTCEIEVGDNPTLNEQGFYEIGSPYQLSWFSQLVNSGTRDAKATLTKDIVAKDDFIPIGKSTGESDNAEVGYIGTFDGNGKTITLDINNKDANEQGLFGEANGGASIKNVGVDGQLVANKSVAGILGAAKTSLSGGKVTISGCWNHATIKGLSKGYIAGILGRSYQNAEVTIDNCYNTGTIGDGISGRYVAAISGLMGTNGKVSNSYNTGELSPSVWAYSFVYYERESEKPTFINSYQKYGKTEEGLTTKTMDEFKSGQVAYLLNGSTSEDPLTWGQKIGINNAPVFHNANNTVYFYKDNNNEVYYNTMDSNITAEVLEVKTTTAKIQVTADPRSEIYYVTSQEQLTKEQVIERINEAQKITLTSTIGQIDIEELTPGEDYNCYLVKKIAEGEYTDPTSLDFVTITIGLNKSTTVLLLGETEELIATIAPVGSSEITWSTTDESVATVNQSGLVTPVGLGEATITVTTTRGNYKATCGVQVKLEYVTESNGEGTVKITGYNGRSKEVDIPATIVGENVTEIGKNAFKNKELTKLTLPDGITSIESFAFSNNKLESIVLPEGITSIGEQAFRSNKIKSVIIPDSLTTLGKNPFYDNHQTVYSIIVPMIIYGKPGSLVEEYTKNTGDKVIFKPTFKLNKSKFFMEIGGEESLIVTKGGVPTSENLSWSSSDSLVASVDNKGLVKALKDGTTQVEVSLDNTGNYTLSCEIVVGKNPTLNSQGFYEIGSPAELNWFSNFVNGGTRDAKGILVQNITASEDFIPIGYGNPDNPEEKGYIGDFDGNGNTVTLRINNPDKTAQGLFGIVGSGASIKNIGIAGKVSGASKTAGLVGVANSAATISNCWNKAEVNTTESETSSGENAAGILGCVLNNALVTIDNCYNAGSISGKKESAGIAGWLGNIATVKNTHNVGSVSGVDEDRGAFARHHYTINPYFTNCYQLDTVGQQAKVTTKTSDDFKSGKLLKILNGSEGIEPPIWGQVIGKDDYPVLYDGTNKLDVLTEILQITSKTAKIKVEGDVDTTIYYIVSQDPLTDEEFSSPTIDESKQITLDHMGDGEINLTSLTPDKNYNYYLVKKTVEDNYSIRSYGKFSTVTLSGDLSEAKKTSAKIRLKGGMNSTIHYVLSETQLTTIVEILQKVDENKKITLDGSGNGEISLTGLTLDKDYYAYLLEDKAEEDYSNIVLVSFKTPTVLEYILNGDEITITSYAGEETEVVIPSEIGGKTVTSIGEYAFYNKKLTSATIPEGVRSIGKYAFYNNELISVTILGSLTSIGEYAFYNNLLTDITIPSGVMRIESYSFMNNKLTNLTISEGVAEIGYSAFENNQLINITIPEGVTKIEGNAFKNNKLTKVKLSKSITHMGGNVFEYNQLSSIVIPSGITYMNSQIFNGNQTNPADLTIYGRGNSQAGWSATNGNHTFIELSVGLDKTQLNISSGLTQALQATISPENIISGTINWSTSNAEVATVNDAGIVTAIAGGQATITARTEEGGFTAICNVAVSQSVESVTLDKKELHLISGGTATLMATILPETATNKNVTWSIGRETIATVSSDGIVTAVGPGTTTITVTTEDGKFTAICQVTVAASTDASISGVKVKEKVATQDATDATVYNIELVAGTDLSELKPADIVVTPTHSKATVITPTTSDDGLTWTVEVRAEDGIEVIYTVNVTVAANAEQEAPTENLTGIAPTSVVNNDGKITGTTTEMEYKLKSAEDAAYVEATEGEITGLSAGTYQVRYAAKTGYNPSPSVEVVVAEYVKSTDDTLSDLKVAGETITGFIANTLKYYVELPAGTTEVPEVTATLRDDRASVKVTQALILPGTATIEVTAEDGRIKKYTINFTVAANANQEAPTETLVGIAPTSAEAKDGKITGTTVDMEYKLLTASEWTTATATEITGLAAGKYQVRYAAKIGFNAGTAVEVVVPVTKYTLTLTGENITSDPEAGQIEENTEVTVTVAPAVGYEVATFKVGGVDKKSELISNKYTFTITEDTIVEVTYEIPASTDATVSEVKVKEKIATVGTDSKVYSIELAAGTDLAELTATDIVVKATDTKATVADAITSNSGATWTVEVTAEDKTTKVTYTINVTVGANANQEAPTETLVGVAPTSAEAKDGKITGTTVDMEYKLLTASEWIPATATEITGLAAGKYQVRYAAKIGFNAGTAVEVVVPVTKYTLTLTGENITSDPEAGQIEVNTEVTVTVAPAVGYEVATFKVGRVDKKSELISNKYTFTITEDTIVEVTYEIPASTDASVSEVKVKEKIATVGTDAKVYSIELAAGTNLAELTATDIVVKATDTKATVADAITSNSGPTWTVEVTAEDKTTKVTYTINVTVGANANQEAPTETLVGVAPTSAEAKDGKITGTTVDMEYKLLTASEWIPATATEITGLAAGKYQVRYAAKIGFNAGTAVEVVVLAYVAPVEVNKEILTTAIQAVTYVAVSEDGKDIEPSEQWTTEEVKGILVNAVTTAQAVVDKEEATQEEVNTAVTTLSNAVEAYNTAKAFGTKQTTVEPVIKTALTTAIQAVTYVAVSEDGKDIEPSEQWTTEEVKGILVNAVTTAQAVVDKEEATQEEVNTAVTTLSNAVEAYNTAKAFGTKQTTVEPVIKTALTTAIQAVTYVAVSEDGKDIEPSEQWTTEEVKGILVNAVTTAQAVVDKEEATQEEVNTAVTTLSNAVEAYNTAKAFGTKQTTVEPVIKTALTTAIQAVTYVAVSEDGKDIEPSEQWTTEEVKGILVNAVTTAQAIVDKEEATQEEVNTAVTTLSNAVDAYNTAKAFGTKQTSVEPEPTTYTVIFKDYDGTVIKTEEVEEGESAKKPSNPIRNGYTFAGWDVSFDDIKADTIVTATYSKNSSDSGNVPSGGSSSPIITPSKITVTNNTVNIEVSQSEVADNIKKAQAEAKKNGTEKDGISVQINADTKNSNANNISANLTNRTIDDLTKAGVKELRINNNVVTVSLDMEALKTVQNEIKTDVEVSVKKVDNNTLTPEVQEIVGNRPVFDFRITGKGGEKVREFGKGKISVSIPYTLGQNEKAENLAIYYIDNEGNVKEMPNSVYDKKNKTLSFVTDHFSKFAVVYKEDKVMMKFTDIENHWAKNYIEFVTSIGLFSGTGNDKFSPDMSMTRGMFVTVLGRLANADVSSYKESSFTDVKADTYYMGYVQWASKNGIVKGMGNDKFAPDVSITREQMAVIMANYSELMDLELTIVNEENTFEDNKEISSYAITAVKQMQMAGIISGKNGNKFDPKSTATRAEVSAVFNRFVELIEKR